MKFPRTGAVAVLLATGLAIVLWWKLAPTGVGSGREAARPEATEPAPPTDLPPAASAPAPTREPLAAEPAANGLWRVELDLRGPGDARLATARVHARRDSAGAGKAQQDGDVDLPWRRDAPALELASAAWTLLAEAESDTSADAIPCGDLVSDPTPLDPKRPPPSPLVVRLHARPGIFGRLLGVEVDPHDRVPARNRFSVRWQPLTAGRSTSPTEIALSGRPATVVEVAAGSFAYYVHDLAPGRYALAGRSDPGGPFEPPCELEVADAMVRQDLSLAAIDAATMLHVVVQGLAPEELARVSFLWIEEGGDTGRGEAMVLRSDAPGSFWVAPVKDEARIVFRWLLVGANASAVKAAVVLVRDGVLATAQPLTSGQHEIVFACDPEARVGVRCAGSSDEVSNLRLLLVPEPATGLLQGPETMLGGSRPLAADADARFEHLVPGPFIASIWGQLRSEVNHGEVWWPLARRRIELHAGDQELALELPPLHPLTIRFDPARFGNGARVELVRRDYARWPIFALPDATGVATFPALPDGDYTVTVVGDMAGEKEFRMPGTSELRIEPTRREDR